MKKSMIRLVAVTVAALAVTGITGGMAGAATATPPAPTPSSGVPIWLLPGVDVGSVLDPTIGLPGEAFGAVDGLLAFVNG